MADQERAIYSFIPWLRQGTAANITVPDKIPNELGAPQPSESLRGVVVMPVTLRVNDTREIARQVRLYGPGDVTGIDPQQVVRTEPRANDREFEPNYFPAIEFDRPDFPWLFTPAKANDAGRLRPWLCLVVVRKQAGTELRVEPGRPLPLVNVPVGDLPDLAECWAWAHAQVSGSPAAQAEIEKALGGNPALTLSRLLCPRRLDPLTEYLACVVPTFELGCKAGLGELIGPDDEKELRPAWQAGANAHTVVKLPVYYHWEFRTGTAGDFESLAARLQPRALPLEAGKRTLDISQPGFVKLDGATLTLEGALCAPRAANEPPHPWPEETRVPFQTALKEILNAPWQALKDGIPETSGDPELGPPIYGCWQAAQNTVEISPIEPPGTPDPQALPTPRWLHQLNLDPRHRVAAALGTMVVQDQQEELMAAAWEQLGEIQRINQLQRQAQLARAVNGAFLARHFDRMTDEAVIKVVGVSQSRLALTTAPVATLALVAPLGRANGTPRVLLSQAIAQSALPDRAVSGPMRRLTSSHATVSTRMRTTRSVASGIIPMLNGDPVVPVQRKPAGWVSIGGVSDEFSAGVGASLQSSRIGTAIDSPRSFSSFQLAAEDDTDTLLGVLGDPGDAPNASPAAQVFLTAALAHQSAVRQTMLGLTWENCLAVFSGGDGIIYSVDHRGRMLFYREKVQDTASGFAKPAVIGPGGWGQFEFLCSGGDGIIYAVDKGGQLFIARDQNQDGTGNVVVSHDPIGGPLTGIAHLFAGGDGILYAVTRAGRVLFLRHETQGGTDQLTPANDIGHVEIGEISFFSSGGNGRIYAVSREGQLLLYRDQNQDGTGSLADHELIGETGWQKLSFFFAGSNGILYAVDRDGRLLTARDTTRDGARKVAPPVPVTPRGHSSGSLPLDLPVTRQAVLQSLNPETTIPVRMRHSRQLGSGRRENPDPLHPVLDEPGFPQPMYAALRELAPEFFFPGMEYVKPNSVTLLEANPQFVEAFLVGLNAEMSREMLWRGFPTDQRGTYFQRFWDDPVGDPDIKRINLWGDTALGENAQSGRSLVLLVRGDLLSRYPNSVVYMAKAGTSGDDGSLQLLEGAENELHPTFRGTLDPDVTFLGFRLTREQAVGENGDPGWFIVIQEQPTEPRFGLAAPDFSQQLPPMTELTTWNDLNWRHLAGTEEELSAITHVALTGVPVTQIRNAAGVWGKNAAHQAFVTRQRPVRVAILASKMIV